MGIEGAPGHDLESFLTVQDKKAAEGAVSQQQTLEEPIERL